MCSTFQFPPPLPPGANLESCPASWLRTRQSALVSILPVQRRCHLALASCAAAPCLLTPSLSGAHCCVCLSTCPVNPQMPDFHSFSCCQWPHISPRATDVSLDPSLSDVDHEPLENHVRYKGRWQLPSYSEEVPLERALLERVRQWCEGGRGGGCSR